MVFIVLGITAIFYLADLEGLKIGSEKVEVGTEEEKQAPNFDLYTVNGKNFSLEGQRGKIAIIDFMALWCKPCREEFSHLKEIRDQFPQEKVEIISIDIDPRESENMIKKAKLALGASWNFAKEPSVGTKYKVTNIPTIYIVDQEGIISYKKVGVAPSSKISNKIKKIL